MPQVFVEVILPLAMRGTFCFEICDPQMADRMRVGMRVVVPLGATKSYTGIVAEIHSRQPDYKRIREVMELCDQEPIVTKLQLEMWHWIADYYMCTLGEVMKAALPMSLKPNGQAEGIDRHSAYKPKIETFYQLNPQLYSPQDNGRTLESLSRAPRQYSLAIKFIEACMPLEPGQPAELSRTQALRLMPTAAVHIRSLLEKGLLSRHEREVTAESTLETTLEKLPQLSEQQTLAYEQLHSGLQSKGVALLHGVTGSGKTEIYINMIARQLEKGADVVYMIPEIALTTQLIDRLRRYFGSRVVVYHSRFNDHHRAECYLSMLDTERQACVLVGARSSILLPTRRLGLVIVDEEHESSYKQVDPAPRYNGRDVAIVMASKASAKVVLGSATPSVESFYNALNGKYALITLNERYGGVQLPTVTISDTMTAVKRGERLAQFNKILIDKIRATIGAGKQVLLFQNRRGFAPYVECESCGHIPGCPDCNVTLTWHRGHNRLECHYCGYSQPMHNRCPKCGSSGVKSMGFGTERVEQDLQQLIPDVRIARLDTDTTRSAKSYGRLIDSISNAEVDVVIGTQMISKGLDFDNIDLVGILNADNLLFYPDFRAAEKGFQMLVQVAGRAGRRDRLGEVVIQSSQPDNLTIRQAAAGDFCAMYNRQICERREFLYPPFCRLIRFTLKHRDQNVLQQAEEFFDRGMRHVFGSRLLGPESPPVDRVRGEFLSTFLLKIEKQRSVAQAKKLIARFLLTMEAESGVKAVRVTVDVDPQ